MASPTLFSLPLFSFFILFLLPSCSSNHPSPVSIDAEPPPGTVVGHLIREACKASNDTSTCESSLTEEYSSRPPTKNATTLMDIIQSALRISSETQNVAISMVHDLTESSPGNKNLTVAAEHCLVGLIYGNYRTDLTANDALPRGRIKDARAWMSATSGYQVGCAAGFKNIKATLKLNETVSFLEKLVVLTNNALSMMMNYDNSGEETASWGPPKTERDGFWERVDVPATGDWSFPVSFTAKEEANVTVCEGKGRCDYEEVQDAVNVAPTTNNAGNSFVIWIKTGVYEEIVRVPLEKKNVVFVGDGMGKTVITGSLNVGIPGISTFDSATVGKSFL